MCLVGVKIVKRSGSSCATARSAVRKKSEEMCAWGVGGGGLSGKEIGQSV